MMVVLGSQVNDCLDAKIVSDKLSVWKGGIVS